MIRLLDVLEMIIPEALARSPYSTYFTGMLLAECKVFGQSPVADYLSDAEFVTIDRGTPLMEALHAMVQYKLINLPVMQDGKLVGILRDRDLFPGDHE